MSGGIISYEEALNEDKTKVYKDKVLTKYNEEKALNDYNNAQKQHKELQKTIKSLREQEEQRLGVEKTELIKLPSNPKTNLIRNTNGSYTFETPLDQAKKVASKNNEKLAYKRYVDETSPIIQQLDEISKQSNNQKLLAKYNYNVAKESNHDINLWDRTGGVITRAIGDFFNPEKASYNNYYQGDNGKMILPTASQMRQENVRNSYGDDIFGKTAKFGTDLGYNLTKIGLSSAINTVVPYAGSTMYFTDMAQDSFNSAKLDGYDDKSAALYSVLGVTSEMVTEKILGGFSSLTGGESAVSSSVNKVLAKVMKNDRLRSVLSNAASEGMEEFVQEFIEKFNHNLVLEKNNLKTSADNTFNHETLEDALYSTLLGMGSGGMMGAANVEINTNNTGVIPNLNNGKTINIDSYANQLQGALNETNNQSKINNINQTLDYLNLNKAAGNELVQSQNLNQNIKTTVPKSNEMVLPKTSDNQINKNLNENIDDEYIKFGKKIEAEEQSIDTNNKIVYNSIEEAVKADPRKASYTKYNESVDFFNLDYDDMRKAIKIGSQYAAEANQMGLDSYVFNDDNNIYYFDIVDKENSAFGIKKVVKIEGDYNDITTREYTNSDSAFSKERVESEAGAFTSNNKSFENRESSTTNVELFGKQQEQSTINENRQSIKNDTKNIRELDNSSLLVDKKTLKGNDVLRAKPAESITRTYTPSEIKDFFQYSDTNNRKIALPDEVGQRLATKTTMTPIEVGRLQSIINSSYDTQINGNHLELLSDYDNNLFNIKATKIGDTYVIDDVVKTSKNSLGSLSNNQNDNINNSKNNTFNEKNGDNVIRNQTDNKNVTKSENNVKDNYKKTVDKSVDTKESKFYKNATETSKFITEDNRSKLSEIGDLKYYESVSNEESLNKASKRLKENGTAEAFRWLQQDTKTSDASDVAEGWILLKNYQDAGDFDSMIAVAKKMREMGTTAGQTVQAYNIMQRLTPEGMVKYAQSELSEAYEFYAKNKSKEWVEKNASKFDLNAQEVGFIVDNMKQVQKMEDGRAKNVKLGEIKKMLTDKLPPERGANIKAWMRISMLFNPKTQVRNVMGNTLIAPVNMVGDYFASKADKLIAKKTGVRTTGTTNIKSYLKGFKKGVYESYDDFKRGINTRNIDANRFELGDSKSFNDNTKLGKTLNKIDTLNGFLLDAGDRGFYEGSFANSINNQLALNNTTKVTQSMIDIATSEALQRTWQDNNNYTKFVLSTRNMLNKVNVKGYGLGDILIPFAKTPANLTKAIVDYSPAGMVKVLIEGRNLKNNISTGTNTAMQQHQFVQDLGKATAGTMLYVAAYGLAKAGIATGKSDDDKDTRDFIKNTLGISSYSIKLGDKSFTYDWAQPVAAPLSIMTNIVNSKNNKGQALLEAVTSSLDSAGSILLEQSFVKSINEVLTDNDGIVSGIENAILDLPTRAVPTFMKQIVDMTDGTQRQTFEYNQPLKTAINKVKAKIPGLSQTLSPSVDTMGREIKKYGGKNNIFNIFLNPANVNTSNISESAKEIYRVYKEVGDNSIMPKVAPYYINSKGEKIILNTEQRKEYQTISGKIIEESIEELIKNKNYKNMSDEDKSEVINNIVNYSYQKAKEEILGMEISGYKSLEKWVDNGNSIASYYANKEEADFSVSSPVKYSTLQNMNVDYYDYKDYQQEVNKIKEKYSGTNNTNLKKQKVFEYINSLNISKNKKIVLFKLLGNYSIKNYSNNIKEYINSFNITAKEKQEIWDSLF